LPECRRYAIYALHIDLQPTSNVFQAGDRIGLEVASSSYPHYQPHPHAADQTVYHDPRHPSHLQLPIIPR
jgi:predicted acyl esterase